MSIYSNVTEKDLINLRKLAEQQKEQRALKIKNRILKQNHDDNLAESLSPITTKLDETSKKIGDVIKESTQNLSNVIKDNNNPQLAIKNTPAPQPIENTPAPQPVIENSSVVIFDVDLENTLNKMVDNTCFFKTHYDQKYGWMLNNIPNKPSGGTEVEVRKYI